ncbi:leucine-rich repeat and immunoglobulin-like domain-containing nogo receptor-interacting protein [Sarotherodon galilaeus]
MSSCCRGKRSDLQSDSMKVLVLLVCLSVGCLAQTTTLHGQKTFILQNPSLIFTGYPPLMSGSLSVSTANQKLLAFSKYIYDGLGERIRFRQFGLYDNKTYHLDVLLLYREGVMYKINNKNRPCTKQYLSPDFHPLAVPRNATLMGQVVLGASSGPGQGVLVNSWYGEQKMKTGSAKYFTTVTEFGCIPVSTLYHTSSDDWVVNSRLVDPQKLNPPFFCMNAEQEDEDEPVTFLSLFKE